MANFVSSKDSFLLLEKKGRGVYFLKMKAKDRIAPKSKRMKLDIDD